jgi:branched chain amino acid efflux pump
MITDPETLLTILGMGAVTYATRVGGYALLRLIPVQGRFKAGLEAVPVAILTAIIAPAVLAAGLADALAALITVLLALRLPMLVSMIGGVGSAVLLRWLIG